jgi:2-polyprenyl-3-methyl-5-hydroxy-6-metoxy-1,4-benzoquinol methylase
MSQITDLEPSVHRDPLHSPVIPCRACSARDARTFFEVREMQFGTRLRFLYFECGACRSLQIVDLPDDLSRYYPKEYFSFSPPRPAAGLHGWLRAIRNRAALTGHGSLGRALISATRYAFAEVGTWLVEERTPLDARVLEVGSGSGQLLHDMAEAGYSKLQGVDPFIARDMRYPNGVVIHKATVHEIDEEFDLILFLHSLEHVPDPRGTLAAAARLLGDGGRCIVWTPTAPCWAWENYGPDWVQLDAPRHILIPSPEAMRLMGEHALLKMTKIRYNSTELQFVGSELYRRDLALIERGGRFTRREIAAYRQRARALNDAGRGDQAAFFFSRA